MTADSTIYFNGVVREEATFSTRVYYSYGNWGTANNMISAQVTSQYGSEPEFRRSSVFTYNRSGRPTEKEGQEGNIFYTYITSGNGFGKIDSISAPDSARTKYLYNALGRTASVKESIGNRQFTTNY